MKQETMYLVHKIAQTLLRQQTLIADLAEVQVLITLWRGPETEREQLRVWVQEQVKEQERLGQATIEAARIITEFAQRED